MKISTVHPDYPPRPKPEPQPEPGAGKFRWAQRLLWILACLQILVGVALVAAAPMEVDSVIARALEEKRMSLYTVQAAPPEKRVEYDQTRASTILVVRMWHAFDIAVGVATVVCALKLRRKPVPMVVSALVLYFALTLANFASPLSRDPMVLGIRAFFLFSLSITVVTMLASHRERLAGATVTSA